MNSPLPPETYDLAGYVKRLMIAALRSVSRQTDGAALKDCVMLARQCGHLSDEETEFYIAVWGLSDA